MPDDYKDLVEEVIIVREFSKEDLARRLNAVRRLWGRVLPKIKEETRMTLFMSLGSVLSWLKSKTCQKTCLRSCFLELVI